MKATIVNLALAAFAFCLATHATAQNADFTNDRLHAKLRICPEPDDIEIWVVNLMNLKTTIMLTTEKGLILSRREVDDYPAWSIKYHLIGSQPGNYRFIVEQSSKSIVRMFHYDKNGITIPEADVIAAVDDI